MYRQFGLGSILEKVPSGEGYTSEAGIISRYYKFLHEARSRR